MCSLKYIQGKLERIRRIGRNGIAWVRNRLELDKEIILSQGLVYSTTLILVWIGYNLNLVEWLKRAGQRVAEKTGNNRERYTLIIIDTYAILKWVVATELWINREQSRAAIILAWYLLASNLFTYIYYHLWDESAYSSLRLASIRRRLINAIQAFSFSNLVYGYFYDVVYCPEFSWSGEKESIGSLAFSVGNSLTVNYGDITPATTAGRIIAVSQLVVTFALVAAIIAKTLGSAVDNKNTAL